MNKVYWEPIMIDYLDGQLSAEKKQELELAIQQTPALKLMLEEFQTIVKEMDEAKELSPSAQADKNFYSFLETEKKQLENKTAPATSRWKKHKILFQFAAAMTLLLIGAAIATIVMQQKKIDHLAMEMNAREDKMLSLLEAQSVSHRIKAVNISYKMQAPNDKIVAALIKVMNTDKSTNVRLAAIEALHKFAREERVKNALVKSLLLQTDPSLQIVLIQILTDIKDKRALDHFEKMVKDSEIKEVVKDEAHLAIFKLS